MISSAECYRHAIEAARLARLAKTRAEQKALWGMSRSWETLGKYALQYEEPWPDFARAEIVLHIRLIGTCGFFRHGAPAFLFGYFPLCDRRSPVCSVSPSFHPRI